MWSFFLLLPHFVDIKKLKCCYLVSFSLRIYVLLAHTSRLLTPDLLPVYQILKYSSAVINFPRKYVIITGADSKLKDI